MIQQYVIYNICICIQKPTVKIHFMTHFAEFNWHMTGSLTKTFQSFWTINFKCRENDFFLLYCLQNLCTFKHSIKFLLLKNLLFSPTNSIKISVCAEDKSSNLYSMKKMLTSSQINVQSKLRWGGNKIWGQRNPWISIQNIV